VWCGASIHHRPRGNVVILSLRKGNERCCCRTRVPAANRRSQLV